MVRPDVLPKDDSLVEGSGTYGTSVRFFARMDTFVLSKGSSVGEGLPAESASVRPFAGVYPEVNLLG